MTAPQISVTPAPTINIASRDQSYTIRTTDNDGVHVQLNEPSVTHIVNTMRDVHVTVSGAAAPTNPLTIAQVHLLNKMNFRAGMNITLVPDDVNETITINSTGGGGGGGSLTIEAFDRTEAYPINSFVTYQGDLFWAHTAVNTPGAWTGSTNWSQLDLEVDVPNLPTAPTTPGIYALSIPTNGTDSWVVPTFPDVPNIPDAPEAEGQYVLQTPAVGDPGWTTLSHPDIPDLPDHPTDQGRYELSVDSSSNPSWIEPPANDDVPEVPDAPSSEGQYILDVNSSGEDSWVANPTPDIPDVPDAPDTEGRYVLNVPSSGEDTWVTDTQADVPEVPDAPDTEGQYVLNVPSSGEDTWVVAPTASSFSSFVSTDTEFDTGTAENKVPNVKQVVTMGNSLENFLARWDSIDGSPGVESEPTATFIQDYVPGEFNAWDSTNQRWALMFHGVGRVNNGLRWTNDAIDWSNGYELVVDLDQNTHNNGPIIFWGTEVASPDLEAGGTTDIISQTGSGFQLEVYDNGENGSGTTGYSEIALSARYSGGPVGEASRITTVDRSHGALAPAAGRAIFERIPVTGRQNISILHFNERIDIRVNGVLYLRYHLTEAQIAAATGPHFGLMGNSLNSAKRCSVRRFAVVNPSLLSAIRDFTSVLPELPANNGERFIVGRAENGQVEWNPSNLPINAPTDQGKYVLERPATGDPTWENLDTDIPELPTDAGDYVLRIPSTGADTWAIAQVNSADTLDVVDFSETATGYTVGQVVKHDGHLWYCHAAFTGPAVWPGVTNFWLMTYRHALPNIPSAPDATGTYILEVPSSGSDTWRRFTVPDIPSPDDTAGLYALRVHELAPRQLDRWESIDIPDIPDAPDTAGSYGLRIIDGQADAWEQLVEGSTLEIATRDEYRAGTITTKVPSVKQVVDDIEKIDDPVFWPGGFDPFKGLSSVEVIEHYEMDDPTNFTGTGGIPDFSITQYYFNNSLFRYDGVIYITDQERGEGNLGTFEERQIRGSIYTPIKDKQGWIGYQKSTGTIKMYQATADYALILDERHINPENIRWRVGFRREKSNVLGVTTDHGNRNQIDRGIMFCIGSNEAFGGSVTQHNKGLIIRLNNLNGDRPEVEVLQGGAPNKRGAVWYPSGFWTGYNDAVQYGDNNDDGETARLVLPDTIGSGVGDDDPIHHLEFQHFHGKLTVYLDNLIVGKYDLKSVPSDYPFRRGDDGNFVGADKWNFIRSFTGAHTGWNVFTTDNDKVHLTSFDLADNADHEEDDQYAKNVLKINGPHTIVKTPGATTLNIQEFPELPDVLSERGMGAFIGQSSTLPTSDNPTWAHDLSWFLHTNVINEFDLTHRSTNLDYISTAGNVTPPNFHGWYLRLVHVSGSTVTPIRDWWIQHHGYHYCFIDTTDHALITKRASFTVNYWQRRFAQQIFEIQVTDNQSFGMWRATEGTYNHSFSSGLRLHLHKLSLL